MEDNHTPVGVTTTIFFWSTMMGQSPRTTFLQFADAVVVQSGRIHPTEENVTPTSECADRYHAGMIQGWPAR
jgi:hypothetical protein